MNPSPSDRQPEPNHLPNPATRNTPAVFGPILSFLIPPLKTDLATMPGTIPGLLQAREQILTTLLRAGVLLASLSYLVSSPLFQDDPLPGNYLLLLVNDGVILGLTWVLALNRRLDYRLRGGLLVGGLYIVSLVELLSFGYGEDTFIFFAGFALLASLFFGQKIGSGALALSMVNLAVIGGLISIGQFAPFTNLLRPIPGSTVFVSITNFLIIVGAMQVGMHALVRRLEEAWRHEYETRGLLEQERDSLEQRVIERTGELAQARDQALAASRNVAAQNEYLTALHQTALDLLNRREVEDLLQVIVERATTILDAPYGEVMLKEGDELVVRAFSQNQAFLLGDRVRRGEGSLSWRAHDTGQPAILDDYSAWPGRRDVYQPVHLQAVADFPIMVGQECLGVLAMGRDKSNYPFDPEAIQKGVLFSQLAALVLDNASLYDAALREIARRKWAEEQLVEARDQALAASRYKTELIAKVSHELRTPLSAILGYTEMLDAEIVGPLALQQKDFTTKILDSTAHLTGMVNDLLDQAQMERGQIQLDIAPFNLSELADRVFVALRLQAEAKGLHLTTRIDPDLPPKLSGDQKRLQQILINLVSNAIKFTETGMISIRFNLCPPMQWAIEVEDTGPGIPQEAQPHIFKPFYQVDDSITRTHQGHGLGLSIVKQLVTLMAGEISLESETGRGTTFTLLLPLEPEIARPRRPVTYQTAQN